MRFKLLNGACPEGIASGSDHAVAVVEESLSNLCRSRGFSGTVDPDQHDDHRNVTGFNETLNAGVEVPITSLEEGMEGALERRFEDL